MITTLSNTIFETWTLTLVHSIWQGLLIFMVVKIILKFVSRSSIRYGAVVVAFICFFLINIFTFYLMLPEAKETTIERFTPGITAMLGSINVNSEAWTSVIQGLLRDRASLILTIWLFGASIFMLRLTGSWWYIQYLTDTGVTVSGMWKEKVNNLTQQLGVKKMVRLIESARIDAPFVAGVLRPVIFVPVGLTTGLSPEQLEAIFIHEIIHIKRNDYLVNLFQSLIESLYFFNPFVWKLSNIIKTEREHCCDDAVVKHGADKKAYVFALAALQESRFYKNGLALSASGNKNQLFNRIKRLMEGSTKNYSLREKLVPVILLAVGFVCASWFSIQRKQMPENQNAKATMVSVSDTIVKKKDKKEKVSKGKNIESDAKTNSQKHTEITYERIETDGDFTPFPSIPDLELPPLTDADFHVVIPDLAELESLQLPPFPAMSFANNYSEEFMEKFKDRFGDFYEKNQAEIEKMMEEIQAETFVNIDSDLMEATAKISADIALQHEKFSKIHEEQAWIHEKEFKDFEVKMRQWEEENRGKIAQLETRTKEFQDNLEEFNMALRKELIRDGYIQENEEIHKMKFVDDVLKQVNDKLIKDSDQKKYKEFYQKHFPKMEKEEE